MREKYAYLPDTGLSLQSIWAWAKRLITDLNKYAAAERPATPTGGLLAWPMPTPPDGWLVCDGGSYATTDYPELFALIGYTFGGAGASFNVPDYRDLILMGAGTIVGVGAEAGNASVTLVTGNVPAHTHSVAQPNNIDSLDDVSVSGTLSSFISSSGLPSAPISTGSTGSGTPFSIIPPVAGINILIKA